jgi:hypothetical protein
MSITGAAVSAEVQPPVGMPLAIGACIGRVVRLLPNGFAVKFVERQTRNDLNRLITRPALLLPSTSRANAAPFSSNSGGDVAA